jgi:iron(III) transport system permease protein
MRIAARAAWAPTVPRISPRYVIMPVLLGVVGLLTAYPIGLLVIKSFQTNRPGLPVRWGLDGWVTAYTEPGILKSLLNTFLIAGIRVPLAIAIAVFFVWICTRTNMPLRGMIDFLMWVSGSARGPTCHCAA